MCLARPELDEKALIHPSPVPPSKPLLRTPLDEAEDAEENDSLEEGEIAEGAATMNTRLDG